MLSGCATQTRPEMPEAKDGIAVSVKFLQLGLNRPLGSYEINASSIIVGQGTEVSKGEAAFGAFGALSAHSRGKEAAKKIIGERESLMKFDVVQDVKAVIKQEAARWRGRTRIDPELPTKGNRVMELEPWVYLTVSPDGTKGRISVYLRAFLKDANGSKIWRGGYNYQSPASRPLDGSDGWFANNAARLRTDIQQGYRLVAWAMMKDSLGASAGWANEQATMRISIPGVPQRFKIEAVILKRSKDMIIYSPKTAEASFIYGVNLVPASEVEILGK
jgi:hypothetical protein